MQHELDRDGIRGNSAEVLGPKDYNRLVASVPDTRRRGRLRFWQEELLNQVTPAAGPDWTPEEFFRVFDGASLLPVPSEPWTREVFLREIQKFPHGGFPLDETPAEWMSAAWEIDWVREELSGEMARTVSKIGELCYTDEYLRFLSRSLSVPRQVELYQHIFDRCSTREEEFRPGFERAFPACVPSLPPPTTHQQLFDENGITEEEYQRRTARRSNPPPPIAEDHEHGAEEEIPF
jgi:hypothetical protein